MALMAAVYANSNDEFDKAVKFSLRTSDINLKPKEMEALRAVVQRNREVLTDYFQQDMASLQSISCCRICFTFCFMAGILAPLQLV